MNWVSILVLSYVVRCAIWYHLYNLKDVKNTHGSVLVLVKLQAEACNFTKRNTPWVFFTFLNCTNGTKSRKASQLRLRRHLLVELC